MEAQAALLPHPSGEAVKTAAVRLGRIRPVSPGPYPALAHTVPSTPMRSGLTPRFRQACQCRTSKIRKLSAPSVTIKAVGILLRMGSAPVLGATMAALVVVPWVSAAPATPGIGLCDAQHSAEETVFLHQQHVLGDPSAKQPDVPSRKLARLLSPSLVPTRRSQDVPPVPTSVGEIAIIEATPEIVSPPNQVDLEGRRILITPRGESFQIESSDATALPPVSAQGVPLDLGDDDAVRIELPFEFTYYGRTYPGAYVHSDGNLTFVAPEASSNYRTYARAAGGPPRIAPLFEDMDPSVAGQIYYAASPDRVLVTWHGIPLWALEGVGNLQTFQLTLGADNSIEFRYGDIDLPAAIVGIFPGDVTRPSLAVDWSSASADVFDETAILAEVFTSATTIDEFAAFHQFFRSQDDAYDSVILFNDIGLDASAHTLAHAYTVRNEVTGIGKPVSNSGPYFGSPRRTGSFVNMGPISAYPDNPVEPIPYRPDSSLLTVLAHEIGHRFLANAIFKDPETGHFNPTTLGRQLNHWSFYFNTDASVLEGNAIRDNGPEADPRFETLVPSRTYSALDKYLMGFFDPDEVKPSFLVEVPSAMSQDARSRSPEAGVKFNGVRKEVRIEDIIAAHGERRPDTSVSQRHFRFAFVLVVDQGTAPDPDTLRRLERLRRLWRGYFIAHLDDRATIATDLVRMLHLSTWPAGGVIADGTGRARIEIAEARNTDLTVRLTLGDAIATVPSTVTIPAGELHAEFEVSGLEAGVTSFVAEASELGYDQPRTRLRVRSGLEGMKMQRMHPPELYGLTGNELRAPLGFVLRDEDHVRYSGVEIEFLAAGEDSPIIASPTTDAFGVVSVNWELGPTPGDTDYVARVKNAPEVAISTTIRSTPGPPTFEVSNVVNAASQAPASPGRGFAPGSLLTLHGSQLALEELVAEPDTETNVPTLPNRLGLIRVPVNGVGAPLVRVSPLQVTFQLPFWAEGPSVNVGMATPYGRSAVAALPVSAVQPGIFPDRIGAAEREDDPLTLQNEALPSAGERLTIHCTGLGAVSPAGRTGLAGDSETPQLVVATTQAWIDNRTVEVEFSGLSTLEAGVYEVIVVLPSDLTAGEHEVQIAADGVRSNTVVFQTQ
ncbi:MAG: hypothetical protein F4Y47_17540 [Acidobacteriia bacterium]|nr:hypothetical protein [Terriglobia bacterium]MYK09687.1 hypothetical protein [Terriglobia bacterium]